MRRRGHIVVNILYTCLAGFVMGALSTHQAFAVTAGSCEKMFLSDSKRDLSPATLRMLREEDPHALSRVKRAVTTDDILKSHQPILGAKRIVDHDRSVFLSVEGVGDMVVYENDDDANEILRLSDIYGNAHEVWTLTAHLNDGRVISLGQYFHGDETEIDGEIVRSEVSRFIAKLSREGELNHVAALEFKHSHPFFEVVTTNGWLRLEALSPQDLLAAGTLIGHGHVLVTAIVPNGHRYTSALWRSGPNAHAENVTREMLK